MLLISSIMKKTRKRFISVSTVLNIQKKSEETLWSLKTVFKTIVNKL